MYVAAIHEIIDVAGFWTAFNALIPEGPTLNLSLPNANGELMICLWEADSVDVVRSAVNDAVGDFSTSGFYEVDADSAIGLEASRAQLLAATVALRGTQSRLRKFRVSHTAAALTTIELAEYERLVNALRRAERRQRDAKRYQHY